MTGIGIAFVNVLLAEITFKNIFGQCRIQEASRFSILKPETQMLLDKKLLAAPKLSYKQRSHDMFAEASKDKACEAVLLP